MQRATLIADLGFARLQLTLDAWQRTDGKAEWAIGGANMLLPAVAQTLAEAKVAAEDCAEKLCELGLRAARGEA
jgi:hypothetical protein